MLGGVGSTDALKSLLGRTVDLSHAIKQLQQVLETAADRVRTPGAELVSVTSNSSLGLRTDPTAATIESSNEINATPTSYSPFGPEFGGSSTSLPTISGVYGGVEDDTLRFEVRSNGTRTVGGSKSIRIDVYNGAGDRIDRINMPEFTPAGTPFELDNGLVLQLGAGTVVKDDTFFVDVSASVGSAVDPAKPFDGTRNDRPNFEEPHTVTDGSFTINGETISVDASDSINDVIGKINASDAGVTATFNAATETIQMTTIDTGSDADIVLADDTSGFLAATKLDTAISTPGLDAEQDKVMDDVAELAAVEAGTFRINGVGISVDPATDSLEDVVDRINASGAGVTASYSTDTNRVTITARSPGDDVVLEDNGTRFLETVRIERGTHESGEEGNGMAGLFDDEEVRDSLENFEDKFNDLFRETFKPGARRDAQRVRAEMENMVVAAFENTLDLDVSDRRLMNSRLGMTFQFGDSEEPALAIDFARLRGLGENKATRLHEMLTTDVRGTNRDGLLAGLEDVLHFFERGFERTVGSRGVLLDIMG